MKVIRPNCRIQFTARDIDFILATLVPASGNADCLVKLLADESARDMILDDERLFHALLEQGGHLKVSTRFYFYVLVRRVFHRQGIEDAEVADYVAELLAYFSKEENTLCLVPGQTRPLRYLFEMIEAMQSADDHTRFELSAHIGNHSLFSTGIFPERIRNRCERRGFPGLSYYEELGRANFRAASHHRLARKYDLGSIYSALSEGFTSMRRALNDLAERLLSISSLDAAAERLLSRRGGLLG